MNDVGPVGDAQRLANIVIGDEQPDTPLFQVKDDLLDVSHRDRVDAGERLIEEHEVDLLVMNTKDEDQLAMHGLAYSLAIELRAIPLLML